VAFIRRASTLARPRLGKLGSRLLRPSAGLYQVADSGTGPVPIVQISSNIVTSASFTPTANALMVAIGMVSNTGAGIISGDVTDSSPSPDWTLVASGTSTAGGWAGVWVMNVGASPSARTVTLSGIGTGAVGLQLTVRVLTGARPAAVCVGGSNGIGGTTAYTIAVTTTVAGSMLIGGQVDNNTAGTPLVPTAATTAYLSSVDTNQVSRYMSMRRTAITATPGITSIGSDGIAGSNQAMAAVEILPSNPNDVSVDADYAFNFLTFDDPTPGVAPNDGTAPANAHQTGTAGITQTTQDGTAPALAHNTGDVTASTTTDTTAPALDHQTGVPSPSLNVPDVTAPALAHQTFDPTVSTSGAATNVNAGDTVITMTAGDPTATITAADTAPAIAHQTGQPTLTQTSTDTVAPALAHQTQAATATTTTADTTAPAVAHQTQPSGATITTTDSIAPALAHQTFDAVASVPGNTDVNPGDNANTHTTPTAAAGLAPSVQTPATAHQTLAVTSTQTTPSETSSITLTAYNAVVTTMDASTARWSFDTGLTETARHDHTTTSTGDQHSTTSQISTLDGTSTGPLVG
jgi:hypothetical protein